MISTMRSAVSFPARILWTQSRTRYGTSLSTDVEGPVEIFWRNARASKQALGEDFEKVLKVLKELEGEREDFKVILQ